MHDAGVAQGRTGESGSHGIEAGGILQPGTGQALRKDAEDEDDDPAPHGHPAQGRMQHEDQGKVDGHPRQVEKGKNSIAAQKVAQLLHVAQVAPAACPARNCGGMLEVHAEHSGAEHVVEGDARTHQKAGAYPLQQGQHDKTDDGGKGDDGECGEIVAGQDLVIDLQHVDGESQLQDVDEHAEKKGISEKIPARAQKFLHVGAYPAVMPPPWGRTPVAAWGPWISGRNVPGRRFAGGTIRTKPFLVQKANQRQKDHKKKYLRPQKNHGIKKNLKKLLGYLFSFLLEQLAGAFRTVQTVGSACQSRSRLSGVQPIEAGIRLHCLAKSTITCRKYKKIYSF